MADGYYLDDKGNKVPVPPDRSSPGISGAIHDAVRAIANFAAPRPIVNRRQKIDQAVDQATGATQNTLGDEF